jgi:hypothetical protein
VTASNWSASEFHWPHVDQIGDGLGEKVWGKPGEPGAVSWQMLYMGLAGSKFHAARPPWAGGENATGNVYGDSSYDVMRPQGGPWPMIDDTFGGQMMGQVRGEKYRLLMIYSLGYMWPCLLAKNLWSTDCCVTTHGVTPLGPL